jgi:trehalose synthase
MEGTPVVAGRAGGILMQMTEGTGGYLINNNDECAERIIQLLRDPPGGPGARN